ARYVHGLILADTKTAADTPEGIEGRKRMLQILAERGGEGVADEMIPKLLGETTRRTRPDVVDRVRGLILANSSAAIDGAIHALMTRSDTSSLTATVHVPALVIV